jgi:branched-chain amino acid transport system ATP-binding protein
MTVELSLREVHAGYGAVEVLHGVDLDVPAGSLTALLGPNGAGKTTLLSTVAGQLPVRSGSISWAGRDIVGTPADSLARAGMLLIPERRGIFTTMSVQDNLEVFAGKGVDLAPALDAFPVLGERRQQRAGSLSGGEQQMLAMSRALTTDPSLLILDEVSMGLAPLILNELYEAVGHLKDMGIAILVVEQFAEIALRVADVAAIMGQGTVRAIGTPAEVAGMLSGSYLGGAA